MEKDELQQGMRIERKKTPVEVVDELPPVAVENQIIYNKTDRYFYIGQDDKKEVN